MKEFLDKPREECGVVGVFGSPKASLQTMLGLFSLQHRGQEGTGIVSHSSALGFRVRRGLGLVSDNYPPEVIKELAGTSAIGHVRYSTSGNNSQENALANVQPLFVELYDGGFALGHNGNLINAVDQREQLKRKGAVIQSSADTAVIIHLTARSRGKDVVSRLASALRQVKGSYSIVALTKDRLIGVRDPHGVRPLVLGQAKDGAWILASETCALDTIGARFVRQVDRGEMVIISRRGIESRRPFARLPGRFCVFEHIYFGRPDSVWDKRTNYAVRKQIGRQLARECPAQADIVVPVPDSGVHGAMGYALKSGLPFELGLTRSHYIGRTFIDPSQVTREEMMRLKFNAIRSEVAGKRVALIDDSVVRGTTSIKVVKMLRKAGAREVHLRSTAPPYYFPCFLGIDTPKQEDLLAYRFKGDLDKMAKHLGVDSLGYISIPGLYQAIQRVPGDPDELALCAGCFSGEYPKYD